MRVVLPIFAIALALGTSAARANQDAHLVPSSVERRYESSAIGPIVVQLESMISPGMQSIITGFSVRIDGVVWVPDDEMLGNLAFYADSHVFIVQPSSEAKRVWIQVAVRNLRQEKTKSAESELVLEFGASGFLSAEIKIVQDGNEKEFQGRIGAMKRKANHPAEPASPSKAGSP